MIAGLQCDITREYADFCYPNSTHGNTIGVLLADLLAFRTTFLETMLLLVLKLHDELVGIFRELILNEVERTLCSKFATDLLCV